MSKILFLCINLPSSLERREAISQQAQKLGIEIHFIQAVDGRTGDIKDFSYSLNKGYLDWRGFELSAAQLGCILSHRRCIEEFLDSSYEYVIVLEDDAKFTNGALVKIEELLKVKNWDLIKLETRHKKLRGFVVKELSTGEILHTSSKGDIGTTALLYNKKGAQKTLNTLHKLRLPMDVHIAHYSCWNIRILDLYPPIIVSDDKGISTIGEACSKKAIHRRKSFYRFIGQSLWSAFRSLKAIIVFISLKYNKS